MYRLPRALLAPRWPVAGARTAAPHAPRRMMTSGGSSDTHSLLNKYAGAVKEARVKPREERISQMKHVPNFKGSTAKPSFFTDRQKKVYLAFFGIAPFCLLYTMYTGSQVLKEIKVRFWDV